MTETQCDRNAVEEIPRSTCGATTGAQRRESREARAARRGTWGDPRWVDAILDWRWTWLLARIALTSAFWISGVTKLFSFPAAVAEQQHFGLQPAAGFAVLTIVVQLLGSALVIAGRLVWLGAGALAVFTMLATLIAHAFWTLQGAERFMAMNTFFEHLGLVAGLLLAALLSEHQQRGRPAD